MAYRTEEDARLLYEWECWERIAGEADDSISERFAGESGAFNDEYDTDGNYIGEPDDFIGPRLPYVPDPNDCPF